MDEFSSKTVSEISQKETVSRLKVGRSRKSGRTGNQIRAEFTLRVWGPQTGNAQFTTRYRSTHVLWMTCPSTVSKPKSVFYNLCDGFIKYELPKSNQMLNFSWCWKINCLGSRVIRTTWVETIPESEMFLLVMHKHGMHIGHFGICRTFSMPFSNVKLGLVCQVLFGPK